MLPPSVLYFFLLVSPLLFFPLFFYIAGKSKQLISSIGEISFFHLITTTTFSLMGPTSNSSKLLNVTKDHCFKVGRSIFHQ